MDTMHDLYDLVNTGLVHTNSATGFGQDYHEFPVKSNSCIEALAGLIEIINMAESVGSYGWMNSRS